MATANTTGARAGRMRSAARRLLSLLQANAGRCLAAVWLFSCLWAGPVFGEQRFPPPDFESGHKIPITTTPAARGWWLAWLDVAVLAATLGVATWLIYRKRSRRSLIWLSLFSIAYFGFWRKGCVCAIGSVQNVVLALADRGYAAPLTVVAFFVLPLALALFAGRAFCAGVCPHGALQDLVLLKPIKLPAWLEQGLGVLPFIYLGAGVLFAATGSAFIFCQYDPFVPLFRLNGRALMVGAGVAFLLLGTVVGRPYCRFLCPYGALLKLCSTVSRRRVRVTPDYCTQCRLCESSCPFGAMREPETGTTAAKVLGGDRRRLTGLLLLIPVLVLAGGWLGGRFSGTAALLNPTVHLADRLVRERDLPSNAASMRPQDLEIERARQTPAEILKSAATIRNRFTIGSWIFGGWVGLVIGAKLVSLSLHRRRTDYEPDRGECFACARCFESCPNELVRRGLPLPPGVAIPHPPLAQANTAEGSV